MPLTTEESVRKQTLQNVAYLMMAAARTAPKGRGRDTLVVALAEGETVERIAVKMEEIGTRTNAHFFGRDAGNVRESGLIVFIGTRISSLGLPACGFCGYGDCETKNEHPETPCTFNSVDLGIALGSAVSIAASHRVDNRIMFSAGSAALELGLFDNDIKQLFGIPISINAKSPFFDRK